MTSANLFLIRDNFSKAVKCAKRERTVIILFTGTHFIINFFLFVGDPIIYNVTIFHVI